jgi:hypothetical protein
VRHNARGGNGRRRRRELRPRDGHAPAQKRWVVVHWARTRICERFLNAINNGLCAWDRVAALCARPVQRGMAWPCFGLRARARALSQGVTGRGDAWSSVSAAATLHQCAGPGVSESLQASRP